MHMMETVLPSAYRDGNNLVIPRGSVLPANCVKCGAPAERPWNKEFSWHTPWLFLLFVLTLLGAVLYLVIAMIIRKKIKLAVPLCDLHHAERRRYMMIGVILLVGCIPFGWFSYGVLGLSDDAGFGIGFLAFFAGLIFCSIGANTIRPKSIDEQKAVFAGISPEFLMLLPERPQF